MSKKFLFASLFLLSSTAAHCMFDDEEKLILVHASTFMSENNKKIAGAQCSLKDGSAPFVEPEGTNIRKRITYHNCLNGMVPDSNHGRKVSPGICVPSDMHTNKDRCAYLDPLSAFHGEVFGGERHDIITIHGHTYGKSSIIIVPNHKEDEFHEKNPHFEGKLVVFDPTVNSLSEMVDQAIKGVQGAPSFAELNDQKNWEDYVAFCKKHNYPHNKSHENTFFMLLERTLTEFHTTISFINRKCNTTPLLPADQIEPLSILIEATLDHIQNKLSTRLSEEKNKAIALWIEDTKNWLGLFKRDAQLRANASKSFFINTLAPEEIQKIVKQYNNTAFLDEIAESLESIEQVSYDNLQLNDGNFVWLPATSYLKTKKSETLFPENSLEKIFVLPLSRIQQLVDTLIEKGYEPHADEISLLYFMKNFESNNESKKSLILQNGENLFIRLLNRLTPSDQLGKRLEDWAWSTLSQDTSYRSHSAISLFNSPAGKALRHKIWGDDSTLDFWTLLKANPKTAILFKDLENEDLLLKKGSFTLNNQCLAERRFTEIVRQWLLERAQKTAVYIPGCTVLQSPLSQPKTMVEELQNPHCSLFNIAYAEELERKLTFYKIALNQAVSDLQNPLYALIHQGCFKSGGDLISQLYDLQGLDENDLPAILKPGILPVNSVMDFGRALDRYLSQLQIDKELFDAFRPLHPEIAEQIETAGETPIVIDNSGDNLWGIDTSGLKPYIKQLNQCINGYKQEIGKNKVTILPNWEQAKILYKRLYELGDSDERVKLDTMMEPIFKTQ